MKKLSLFLSLLILSGCFGENYSTGHPVTTLHIQNEAYQVEPIYIGWNSQAETTNFKIEDEASYFEKLEAITVLSNETMKVTFADSKKDKGEYTDVEIEVIVKKEGISTKLYEASIMNSNLNESHLFQAPIEQGTYELEVKFISNGNYAEYMQKLIVQ